MAVIEFARNVCGLKDANTTEVDSSTKHPVIDVLPAQKKILANHDYGGTMRLGVYAAKLDRGTNVYSLYKEAGRLKKDMKRLENRRMERFRKGKMKREDIVLERHRHRYEVNPRFIDRISKKGMVFSGYHVRVDGTKLMEFIELPKHKFFVATQAHPEFKSSLGKPAPLFFGFVRAAMGK